MPSPVIPAARSKSAPISPNRSSRSSGSSWLQSWTTNINKLGSFIISSAGRSPNPHLTEEGLEAHNNTTHAHKDHVILLHRNSRCSPYYKGLTDASLVINRNKTSTSTTTTTTTTFDQQQQQQLVCSSPGRESNSTSASSSSSFILKIQDWGSCLSFKSTTTPTTASLGSGSLAYKSSSSSTSTCRNVINTTTTTTTCSNTFSSADDRGILKKSSTKPSRNNNNNNSNSNNRAGHQIPGLSSVAPNSAESSWVQGLDSDDDKDIIIKSKKKPLRERSVQVLPTTDVNDDTNYSNQAAAGDDDDTVTDEHEGAGGGSGTDFGWADKYQPKALSDFICNQDKAAQVQALMKRVDCNHFIFEGPAGVGKRTMIWAMLQEAFGPERIKTREECKTFNLKGEVVNSVKVRLKVSSQHMEVNLSDMKGYEKHVIVELIKETHNRISNLHLSSHHPGGCQAIVLYEADKLTTEALLYIKWLLERYKGFTKFFFCCSDVSKLQPIKALCTLIQLSPPSHPEIVRVLEFIAEQEGIKLPRRLGERIAAGSKNNLRQAIRSFEASWRSSYPVLTEDQVILSGWEKDIANIATNMIQEQSPKQLYIIRGKLLSLIDHDVSTDYIFESLARELKDQLGETFHRQIDSMLQQYYKGDDGNWLDGENPRRRDPIQDAASKKIDKFTRIEEYIAKFMSFYKCTVAHNKDQR